MDWKKEIRAYEKELIQDLVQFLQIPSVLNEKDTKPGAPFGEDVNKALQFMLSLGDKDGFVTKDVEGYAGHIEWGQGEELVGVLGHVDVVPEGDGWDFPPYSAHIENGRIYARGAQDDKGPTIAAYYGLKLLKDKGFSFDKRVRLILGADEESGWRCVKKYFEREEMPSVGFAPDASFPMIYAEKGISDSKFTIKETPNLLISFQSGHRLNMVPDFAKCELEREVAPLDVFHKFCVAHGVEGQAKITEQGVTYEVKGISAHGSEPEKGLNAATLLGLFLESYLSSKGIFALAQLHNDLKGDKNGFDMHDDVTGPLTFNVGLATFQKGEWTIGCNVRYPVTIPFNQVNINMKALGQKLQGELSSITNTNPHYMPEDSTLVQTLMKVYESVTGRKENLQTTGGGTYARALKQGVAFGALFPEEKEYYHQRNESADLNKLLDAAAIYAAAIYELACKK